MPVRPVDILTNLNNFDGWDIKNYPLTRSEAKEFIKTCMFAQQHWQEYEEFCKTLDEE